MFWVFIVSLRVSAVSVPAAAQTGTDACGEVVTLKTHGAATMRYALSQPKAPPAQGGPIALVLLRAAAGMPPTSARAPRRELLNPESSLTAL